MDVIEEELAEFGMQIPEIMMPIRRLDIEKWAVFPCDQWAQDRDYWKTIQGFVNDAPSTLNMILPDVYLNDAGRSHRIQKIHETMRDYLASCYAENPILTPSRRAGAFIEREISSGIRRGLIAAVDLEKYDWRNNSETMIRGAEATIESHILPHIEVRRKAPLELPHILLLVDDVEDMLMSVITKLMNGAPCAYDSPLMMEAGNIRSRLFYRKNDWAFIYNTLELLYRKSCTKFNTEKGFLFAVGDGNHSLAAAKTVWDEYKAAHAGESGIESHPARYALVEIVNLHDPSLIFRPVHRMLSGIDLQTVLDALKHLPQFSFKKMRNFKALSAQVQSENSICNRIGLVSGKTCILVEFAPATIAAAQIAPILDTLIANTATETSLDYIHAEYILRDITGKTGGTHGTGILMPPFPKNKLFETVIKNGLLPAKTFSIGDPNEKRFYMECRKLFA